MTTAPVPNPPADQPRSFHLANFISVTCYECGLDGSGLHGMPYYIDPDWMLYALAYSGWTRALDAEPAPLDTVSASPLLPPEVAAQQWRCPTCTEQHTCAATGHLPVTMPAKTGAVFRYGLYRTCGRCGWLLTRPTETRTPRWQAAYLTLRDHLRIGITTARVRLAAAIDPYALPAPSTVAEFEFEF
ncbi:hypothetical protein [Streptosporangium saharense]|uniref:Uncharacterized protein n=1 Tax=Streptosporangium saharense TaxID=1706840 RepID=A0A7W7QHS8_9ACTN|nr:hypothetical protein [Streptosporangium saharense]MBB4913331.1 hypothetical protein [Streptosporangium saharense]